MEIVIRPLVEEDLDEASLIVRVAFATFLDAQDRLSRGCGTDYVYTRWRSDPSAAFAAEHDGRLIGSNFAARWGSFGFFGPLTVLPEYWGKKVSQRLMDRTMARFAQWGLDHVGLFTFPDSPTHINLYQKYGFWPGHLTSIMAKQVAAGHDLSAQVISSLAPVNREATIEACAQLTNEIHEGLDVRREILAGLEQGLGESVLVYDQTRLVAFAVCHCGSGSEGGDGTCLVKFGAVRPGEGAASNFTRLLRAVESVAALHELSGLVVGMNTARRRAYRQLLDLGFRTEFIGVAMETTPEKSYNRADVYVIDDWR